MEFKMDHQNFNVADLDKSIAFYQEALGLHEVRRNEAADGSYKIVYMGNEVSNFQLELTWMRDHPQKYDLGECEFHLAFRVDDYPAAYEKHSKMATRPWGFILSMIRMGIGWKFAPTEIESEEKDLEHCVPGLFLS